MRIGKYVDMTVEDGPENERLGTDAQVKEMCDKLLANPVIEDYRYEVTA